MVTKSVDVVIPACETLWAEFTIQLRYLEFDPEAVVAEGEGSDAYVELTRHQFEEGHRPRRVKEEVAGNGDGSQKFLQAT